MSQLHWKFDRGEPEPGGEVQIQCTISLGEPGGQTVMQFIIPESAASQMRNDLSTVLRGITVAQTIEEGIAP